MEKNMGMADRIIRSALAAGFLGLFATGKVSGTAGKILLGLSGIFVATSAVGSCPAYQALGVSTISDAEAVSVP